ncbi:hypothetical protein FGO68_gene982 [Halteria grandinella]|uniref:Uncharacterized protein n=1 Tax=Halteria grandinella TaxID=5974 RepID=A0A8J8NRN7_HALGN|nr:hypothetical protein FGO68_gene982 [Halteria grandinella]
MLFFEQYQVPYQVISTISLLQFIVFIFATLSFLCIIIFAAYFNLSIDQVGFALISLSIKSALICISVLYDMVKMVPYQSFEDHQVQKNRGNCDLYFHSLM